MDPEQTATNGSLANSPFDKVLSNIKSFWSNSPKKIKIVLLLSIAAISVLVFAVFYTKNKNLPGPFNGKSGKEVVLEQISQGFEKLKIPQRETPFFALSSRTKSKYGIIPQEVFILKSKEPIDKNFVSENLKSSVPVVLSAVSPSEFQITPKNSLPNDQVFNISLATADKENSNHKFDRNYGWTFQTQGKFRVKTTIPGDKKNGVPLNTGIEITFSQDDFNDPTPYLKIDPPVSYRTEVHGEAFAVVPLQPLSPETIYTVTLRKGLNLKSRNDPLEEDLTFTFQTQSRDIYDKQGQFIQLSLSKNLIEVAPDEVPVVGVYAQNWKNDPSVKTEIYKFSSGGDFINSRSEIDKAEGSWYSYFSDKNKVSTSGLAKVGEADLKLQNKENIDFIQLPGTLEPGYYLVQFSYADNKKFEQLWLQSSYLSAYTSIGRRQSLVWVNDIKTHLPVDTAFVKSPGTSVNSVTNDKGVSIFTTPQEFYGPSRHYLQVSSSDGKELVLPVNSLSSKADGTTENRSDYWSYLYHERLLYKPGDTVNFWGVVKKRDNGAVPSPVTISVSTGYYGSEAGNELATATVTPQPDGSFIGSIPLGNIDQGWYSLQLKVNKLVLSDSSFEITDYVKPEMKIEVVPSKNAIFAGETVNFSGKVSFFDETPVKGVPLKIYAPSSEDTDSEMKTDNKGLFNYAYKSKYSGSTTYYPNYEGVTINPALSESSTIEGYGSVKVYGSKIMFTTKSSQEGTKAKFEGTINKVDLTNINKGLSSDARGDVIPNKEVTLTVTKTWWVQVQSGTYYDFIEKVTRPSYRYERHDEKIVDTKLKSDSGGKINYDFNLEEQKSYQLEITAEDEDKHVISAKQYYYYYKVYDSQDDRYAVPELTSDKEENSYSVGESVNLSVNYKGQPYKDTDTNRFLFILAERGTQKALVEDSPKLSFDFRNEYIPNIYVASVIFTGNHYEQASPNCRRCSYYYYYYDDYYFNALEVRYKKEDSQLDVKVTPGREKYEPGENARITINVSKNGVPVEGTNVNMIVVDTALEAIGGVIKPSVLNDLYASVPNEIYYNYYSHKSLFAKPPGAEMGGGGGPREIFKDTAFFGQAKSGSGGDAVFEFKLPDNITSWNIYAQAVSDNLDAGQSEGKIITSKEFFVTSNFPRSILQEDKMFVTANSFGNSVSPNQQVSYEFYLSQNENQFGKLSKTGTTSKDVSFQVPRLSVGNYKAILTGKVGELDDTLIYPIEVTDSRLNFVSDKSFDLSSGSKITQLNLGGVQKDKPVRLILTDAGKGKYYFQLYNYCYGGSNRLEKKLAKRKAGQVISDRFHESVCKFDESELSGFQNYDGGLSQVNWGGSDLGTTVWSVYVDKELFDKEKLKKYLENRLNEGNAGSVQRIYSDWGLTLLGVPKINDLRQLAESATSFEEKILSALALSSAGETEISRDLYYDILADYGYTNKPYVRIQRQQEDLKKSSVDDFVKDSSYALLLGSIVEPTYNEGLYSYLRDYQYDAQDIVIDLGKMSFINQELSRLPDEDTKVNVKTNLRDSSYNLAKGGSESLILNDSEVESTSISVSAGKAEARAIFNITPQALSKIPKDNRLSVKRSYRKTGGEGAIKPGDIVEITVDFNLDFDKSPRGGFEITDYLPSGLIFLPDPGLYGFSNASWVYPLSPNVIKYSFYNSPWWQRYGEKSFKYYARASSPGTYIGEPTTMQSMIDLSVLNYTDKASLDISEQ